MTKFKMFRDKIFILWELHSKILVGDKNFEQEQTDRQVGGSEQGQADRQVGGHYYWAVELEQGPHSLPLAPTVPVVFSF
jgi:hypothetical protein